MSWFCRKHWVKMSRNKWTGGQIQPQSLYWPLAFWGETLAIADPPRRCHIVKSLLFSVSKAGTLKKKRVSPKNESPSIKLRWCAYSRWLTVSKTTHGNKMASVKFCEWGWGGCGAHQVVSPAYIISSAVCWHSSYVSPMQNLFSVYLQHELNITGFSSPCKLLPYTGGIGSSIGSGSMK